MTGYNKKAYIAYGSNLNVSQMAHRCPDARVLGKAMLKGYKLTFRGVATIEPDEDSEVPVAVWALTRQCERALDLYEGYPHLYRKEELEVEVRGQTLRAIVYIMNSGQPQLPSINYLNVIYDGYNDVGLDLRYLEGAVEDTKKRI